MTRFDQTGVTLTKYQNNAALGVNILPDAIRPRNPLALILGETGKHDGCTRRRPSRRPRVHCTYVGDTGTAGSHRP